MSQYLSLNSALNGAQIQCLENALEVQQAAQEFRFEVERRQAHEDYCQWYYRVAAQNQAELAAMENDVNFYGWFCNRHEP